MTKTRPNIAGILLGYCMPLLSLWMMAGQLVFAAQTPGGYDLRHNAWNEGKVFRLDGDWIWQPGQWLNAEQIEALPLSERQYTAVPGFWNEQEHESPTFGYGTLAIRLYLPDNQTHYLQLSDVASAYRLYIDNLLVGGVGIPSQTAGFETPMFQPFITELHSIGEPVWIVLHISNHEYKQIGVRRSVHITDQSGYHWLRETPLLFDVFFCGVLLTLGCLSITRFLRRRNEHASLFLGLFSLMVGTRALLVGERVLYQLDWFSFAFLQRLEHVLVYAGLAAFAAYLYELMDGGMPRKVFNVLWIASAILIVLTIFLPLHLGTLTVVPFKLLVACSAIYVVVAYWPSLRARGAGVFWFGMSFAALLTTLAIDLLNQNTQLQSRPVIHWGMIFFVVFQGLFLNHIRHWRKQRLMNKATESNTDSETPHSELLNELGHSREKIEQLEWQMQQLRHELVGAQPAPAFSAPKLEPVPVVSQPETRAPNENTDHHAHDKEKERRQALVKLLQISLGLWERFAGKSKVHLAEESQCWRVYVDGSTVKTRTFDKYLKENTLPQKPRWRLVIRTAYFVLENTELPDDEKQDLSSKIELVQSLFDE